MEENIWNEVFTRDNGTCQFCGKDQLHTVSDLISTKIIDIFPTDEDEEENADNMVVCCAGCDYLLAEFDGESNLIEMKKYVEALHKELKPDFEEKVKALRK